MRPMELLHRVHEKLIVQALFFQYQISPKKFVGHYTSENVGNFSFCRDLDDRLPSLPWDLPSDTHTQESLLSGHLNVLGYGWTWQNEALTWRQAPDTGNTWPQEFFHNILYREGNPYGDVRIAWEPSRLQHFVALALYARQAEPTARHQAVSLLEQQFFSWVSANPLMMGIHYISVMECALRLIAVCHAFDLIRKWLLDPQRVWAGVLNLVKGHAWLINKRISQHSSAGNHTVAEGTGLIYGGILFPEMNQAKEWLRTGLALLEQEGTRQINSDGGGREQGFWYLRFVSDLYGLAITLLKHYHHPIPMELERVFERSCSFLNSMALPDRWSLPSIGDSDNGYALSPYLHFGFPSPKPKPGMESFTPSGYTVIQPSHGERLLFDHGPLGLSPCYGHGHADALSIVLSQGAREFLLDPGTFSYTGHPQWRRYFRGTRAHNTVTVNQQDQAIQESAFLWSQPFEARLIYEEESPDGKIFLLGSHNGYLQRFGVTHWRGIIHYPEGWWMIWDRLTGPGKHHLELNWHCAEDPLVYDDLTECHFDSSFFRLRVSGGDTTFHRGETSPIKGWRSPEYGVKVPCTTLSVHHFGPLPHEFHTRIWSHPSQPPDIIPAEDIRTFRQLVYDTQAN